MARQIRHRLFINKNMHLKKYGVQIFVALTMLSLALSAGPLAHAASLKDSILGTGTEYDTLNSKAGLNINNPTTFRSPGEVIYNVLSFLLGFLGVLCVVLFIYAGFLWMTAGGEDKKTEDAKKYMLNAVIGLAIILAAWMLTAFVIKSLVDTILGSTPGNSNVMGNQTF